MASYEGFPLILLGQPMVDRMAYFHNYTMAHPKLLELIKETSSN